MIYQEFLAEIDDVYEIIMKRFYHIESCYLAKGYVNHKITFEDVDLDDLLESKLVPLFMPIFDRYPHPHNKVKQMRTILVATLCEIAKRGLSQGGILKTLETYIGCNFDRNKYYRIIPEVLREENIEVILKSGKKYENAIICEAGIPRNMHGIVMTFFLIYWKWFENVGESVRQNELKAFLLKGHFSDEYILDSEDYDKLRRCSQAIEMNNASVKALKICIRLEDVFSELEKNEDIVTDSKFNEVCERISKTLGYNILTIVNGRDLKRAVLAYTKKVTFSKFDRIIDNLASNELIHTPTGKDVFRRQLSKDDLMCGFYKVRNIEYEVTYPLPLGVIDLLNLEQNKIHYMNGYSVYVSKSPFLVEIDGWNQTVRRLCYKDKYMHVYAGKIRAAAVAYIDDSPVNPIEDAKLIVGIKRHWDYDRNCNTLGINIYNLSVYKPELRMKNLELKVDNHIVRKRINSHGFVRLLDQWFEIKGREKSVLIQVSVDGEQLIEKEFYLPENILIGKYTGIKIDKILELENWYSGGDVVYFTKEKVVSTANIWLNCVGCFGDYKVYEGVIDLKQKSFGINDNKYEIKRTPDPFLTLSCDYEYINEKYIVKKFEDAQVQLNKGTQDSKGLLLKMVHVDDNFTRTIGVDEGDMINILDSFCDQDNHTGKWEIMLVKEQKIVSRVEFIVLPKVSIKSKKSIVKRGDVCEFIISSNALCFEYDGELFKEKSFYIDTSRLIGDLQSFSEGIQKQVYFDSCEVYYPLIFPINIWDAYIEQKGERKTTNTINLEDLDKTNIILESNSKNQLGICINDEEHFLYADIGKNVLNIKKMLSSFKQRNIIKIMDYVGGEKNIDVLYFPTIKLLPGYERKQDEISFGIKYIGPVGMKVGVEVFEDYRRLHRTEIVTDDNASIYRVKIKDPQNKEHHFTVEVDFNGRGKRNIGNVHVEKIIIQQRFNLSNYVNLFNALEFENETNKLTTNLYEVLELGGKIDEV